jgi:hypothetical protein
MKPIKLFIFYMKINGVFNKKWNIYVLFLTIANVNFKNK